jgi:hypothetical protein
MQSTVIHANAVNLYKYQHTHDNTLRAQCTLDPHGVGQRRQKPAHTKGYTEYNGEQGSTERKTGRNNDLNDHERTADQPLRVPDVHDGPAVALGGIVIDNPDPAHHHVYHAHGTVDTFGTNAGSLDHAVQARCGQNTVKYHSQQGT